MLQAKMRTAGMIILLASIGKLDEAGRNERAAVPSAGA
jgi:hypothetical protein